MSVLVFGPDFVARFIEITGGVIDPEDVVALSSFEDVKKLLDKHGIQKVEADKLSLLVMAFNDGSDAHSMCFSNNYNASECYVPCPISLGMH